MTGATHTASQYCSGPIPVVHLLIGWLHHLGQRLSRPVTPIKKEARIFFLEVGVLDGCPVTSFFASSLATTFTHGQFADKNQSWQAL